MEIGHQQADSSFPILARHGRFESNPGGEAHRSGNSIAARDNIRVRELQCGGETNFARRELALEPVPITVLVLPIHLAESVTFVMCKDRCNMSSSFSVGFQSHRQSSAAWTRQ